MPVPDFQTLMRPLLEEYASGGERPIADVRAALASRFDLTVEELAERLPSGVARTFDNRVGWAVTYLYRVGLLSRPRRAVYSITARGRNVLVENPERVDLGTLAQFPEFAEFRKVSGRRKTVDTVTAIEADTPEERIDHAWNELRSALAVELRQLIATISPEAFEDLVLKVLHAMGYGDGSEDSGLRTGRSGDAGIDGLIREDRLGLDVVYVQAKRWEKSVGRPEVQGFVGALQGKRASKGIIFTASDFTNDARQYADTVSPRVVLVDGGTLAGLMFDYNVGVADYHSYAVKRVDHDFFSEET